MISIKEDSPLLNSDNVDLDHLVSEEGYIDCFSIRVIDGKYLTYYGANDTLFNNLFPEIAGTRATGKMSAIWLDSLYNQGNPTNHCFANGNLRQSAYKELMKRLRSDHVNISPVTQNLLNFIHEKWITQENTRFPLEEPIHLWHFKNWLSTNCKTIRRQEWDYYIGQCDFTKQIIPVGKGITRTVYDTPTTVDYRFYNRYITDLTPYGYQFVTPGSSNIMALDLVYLNGSIFYANAVVNNTCSCCHETFYTAETLTEEPLCTRCAETQYKIHGYSTRVPSLLKFKAKKVKIDTIYYGVELEYECESVQKSRVAVGKLIQGHAIMKSDGSINNGFEIVTCPATSEIHLEEFKKFFDNFSSLGVSSEGNVGMHIHISRKPLSWLTIGKMTQFLNSPHNKAFVTSIAGRELNQYCRQEETRTITTPFLDAGARYNPLNLNNAETIEMRIFKTPESFEEFAAKLQFAEALTAYCSPCTIGKSLKEITTADTFKAWLGQQGKQYQYLNNFIKGL
jgi:hypothetical protein